MHRRVIPLPKLAALLLGALVAVWAPAAAMQSAPPMGRSSRTLSLTPS